MNLYICVNVVMYEYVSVYACVCACKFNKIFLPVY